MTADKKATHPQPVTPAGGEVEPVAWLHKDGYTMMLDKESDRFTHPEYWTALYTHPPVADAALVRDAERYRHLRDAHSEKWTDAATGTMPTCSIDFAWRGHDIDAAVDESMQDAALNQRGGGDHG